MKIAVIGDIHGAWDESDRAFFDRSGHRLVIIVGDLAGLLWRGTLDVARRLSHLSVPALVLPGNHDATHLVALGAEVAGRRGLGRWFSGVMARRVEALREALEPVPLAGYSCHDLGDDLAVIASRPHSMGGPELSFPGLMEQAWDIDSIEASAERLCALVDETSARRLVFVGHNGPTGLGEARDSLWGRDFHRDEGDWGNPDLRMAIDHAEAQGKEVLAVVAGHMHRGLRGGGDRHWNVECDGTLYVNAAEVPRIRGARHHHVELSIADGVEVSDRWVTP